MFIVCKIDHLSHISPQSVLKTVPTSLHSFIALVQWHTTSGAHFSELILFSLSLSV